MALDICFVAVEHTTAAEPIERFGLDRFLDKRTPESKYAVRYNGETVEGFGRKVKLGMGEHMRYACWHAGWTSHLFPDIPMEHWFDFQKMFRLVNIGGKFQEVVFSVLMHNCGAYPPLGKKVELLEALFHAVKDLRDMKSSLLWMETLQDEEINRTGVPVNDFLIEAIAGNVRDRKGELNVQMSDLTHGKVSSATARGEFRKWMLGRGFTLPDMGTETIAKAVAGSNDKDALAACDIYAEASRTSVAKWEAARDRQLRGRVRHAFVFGEANTGRWASWGVQFHNFPRAARVAPMIDKNLHEYAAGLRQMVSPEMGKRLVISDFKQIELRVLLWVCGEAKVLDDLRDGKDLYVEFARRVFGVQDIDKETRHIAKCAVLGLGYGQTLSGLKWQLRNLIETDPKAEAKVKEAYNGYHKLFRSVKRLWADLERVAFEGNTGFEAGICGCYKPEVTDVEAGEYKGHRLSLPSGRGLHMWNIGVWKETWKKTNWGATFTENVCSGTARDILARTMMNFRKIVEQPDEHEKWIPRIVMHVHDEIVVEYEEGELQFRETKDALERAAEKAGQSICPGMPIALETRHGSRWCD